MSNETLRMELEDFIEMLRSDVEMLSDSSHPTEKIVRNYLTDIEEIYNRTYGEE